MSGYVHVAVAVKVHVHVHVHVHVLAAPGRPAAGAYDPFMPQPPSGLVRALGGMALQSVRDAIARNTKSATEDAGPTAIEARDEPPVVAQLMIEIRSDGSHTIARGALHDLRTQESAHVHAEGNTPGQLIASLLNSLLRLPAGTFERLRPPTDSNDPSKSLPHKR